MLLNVRTYALAYSYAISGLVTGLILAILSSQAWSSVLYVLLGLLICAATFSNAKRLLEHEIKPIALRTIASFTTLSSFFTLLLSGLAAFGTWIGHATWVAPIVLLMAFALAIYARGFRNLTDDVPYLRPRPHLLMYATTEQLIPSKVERREPIGCVLQLATWCTLGLLYMLLWLTIEIICTAIAFTLSIPWRWALLRPVQQTSAVAVWSLVPAGFSCALGYGLHYLLTRSYSF
jgi:hypothetical protein